MNRSLIRFAKVFVSAIVAQLAIVVVANPDAIYSVDVWKVALTSGIAGLIMFVDKYLREK